MNELDKLENPLLSKEGWPEGPGWFPTPLRFRMGTTPREIFDLAALLTQEGTARNSKSFTNHPAAQLNSD